MLLLISTALLMATIHDEYNTDSLKCEKGLKQGFEATFNSLLQVLLEIFFGTVVCVIVYVVVGVRDACV